MEYTCMVIAGARYSDKIRLYADTPQADSAEEQLKWIKYRIEYQESE